MKVREIIKEQQQLNEFAPLAWVAAVAANELFQFLWAGLNAYFLYVTISDIVDLIKDPASFKDKSIEEQIGIIVGIVFMKYPAGKTGELTAMILKKLPDSMKTKLVNLVIQQLEKKMATTAPTVGRTPGSATTSTGGTVTSTPTGQVHKANPNNPNLATASPAAPVKPKNPNLVDRPYSK
jgi:hypothetical protein